MPVRRRRIRDRRRRLEGGLRDRFQLTNDENVDLFVGMNIYENSDGVPWRLSSEAYIKSLAGKYLVRPLDSYPRAETPATNELRAAYDEALNAHEDGAVSDPALLRDYGSLVGALIYAIPGVRVQEAQCVAMLARALTFPTQRLYACAIRCLVVIRLYMARTGHAAPCSAFSD